MICVEIRAARQLGLAFTAAESELMNGAGLIDYYMSTDDGSYSSILKAVRSMTN